MAGSTRCLAPDVLLDRARPARIERVVPHAGHNDAMMELIDGNPPDEKCPRTGLAIYRRRGRLHKLVNAAAKAGVPGADRVAVKPCYVCLGFHLVESTDAPAPAKVETPSPACTKRRFKTQLDARIALARMRASGKEKRREQRAYRCHICRGWHLTSQP